MVFMRSNWCFRTLTLGPGELMACKRLDPHPANWGTAFFFPFVAHCPDFSISQTFHPRSSLGDHPRGLHVDVTDLQGSFVLLSALLSVLPATWNSPMGFMHQSGISGFYSGCFERNPIRINSIQQRGVYCTDSTGISRETPRGHRMDQNIKNKGCSFYITGAACSFST